ncbi:MAG TPA: hypothetical protein PKD80_13025 [Microthrixaceae bacterium]|nr:hypothetical protein [Microthrixaceae bacterium]HMS14018.1 hypothetical protein [Microthrixaceae bacterium]HMT25838.1 hypothetical protein [Microthrixaceae bacterium]
MDRVAAHDAARGLRPVGRPASTERTVRRALFMAYGSVLVWIVAFLGALALAALTWALAGVGFDAPDGSGGACRDGVGVGCPRWVFVVDVLTRPAVAVSVCLLAFVVTSAVSAWSIRRALRLTRNGRAVG